MKIKQHIKKKTLNKSKLIHLKPSAPIEKPTRPMQVCTMMLHIPDCLLFSDQDFLPLGRPTLYDMVDEASQSVCGFHVSLNPPGWRSVASCMRHAFYPKDYVHDLYPDIKHEWKNHGLPEVLLVDYAKEFQHPHIENACFKLGITLKKTRPFYKSSGSFL